MQTITNTAGAEVTVWTTLEEALQREVIEPLEAGEVEDAEAEFDLDGIVADCITRHEAIDADGTQHLDKMGFYIDVDHEDFWASVQRHAR